jgi:ProP effector
MRAKNGAGSAAAETASEARRIDSGNCQSFSQKPKNTQADRRAAAIKTLLALRQNFPAAIARLDVTRRQPLKVGIAADIAAAMPEIAAAEIALALKIYTSHVGYLTACIEGAERIDLAGQPAGAVTASEAAYAAKLFTKIRRSRPTPVPPPASTSPPKKISIADLKAAAARKRAAMA